jgi:hypothetical protein
MNKDLQVLDMSRKFTYLSAAKKTNNRNHLT